MKQHTITTITLAPKRAYCQTQVVFWEKPLTPATVIEALNILYAQDEAEDVSDWDEDAQEEHTDTLASIARAIELAEHTDFDVPAGRSDVKVCGIEIGHIHIENSEVFVL